MTRSIKRAKNKSFAEWREWKSGAAQSEGAQGSLRGGIEDGGLKPPLQVESKIGARRNDRSEIPHSPDSVRNDGFVSLLDGATF